MMNFWQKFNPFKVDTRLAGDLLQQSQSAVSEMPPLNILLVGKTGSGKSTLVNALFREKIADTGVGLPITQGIRKITKEGIPMTLYDTRGLELNTSVQRESMNQLLSLIQQQKAKGEKEAIHLVYYCINASMARIEPQEMALIEALTEQVPVMAILTQAIGEEVTRFKETIQAHLPRVAKVIPVLAQDFVLGQGQRIQAFGLDRVVQESMAVLPDEVQEAFINAQQVDLDLKVKKARSWAHTYISSAFGIGFIPIPIADSALLVPMQITMLAQITSIFGLALDRAQILSIIAGIGGTSGTTLLGKYLASSALKLIPGVGTFKGGVVSGTTAASLTLALAYSYIEVLKQVALADLKGKEFPLKELQTFMNRNFSSQLQAMSQRGGQNKVKEILPDWFESFLDRSKRSR